MNEQMILVTGMLCDEQVFEPWPYRRSPFGSFHVVQPTFTSVTAARDHILSQSADQFTLIGYSLGGIVGLACAVAAPERLSRLALISTNPYRPTAAQRHHWAAWTARCLDGEFPAVITEATEAMTCSYTRPEHRDRALEMAMRVGPESLLRTLQLQQSRPDADWDLSKITTPTLVIAGTEDPLCPPPFQERLARAIPLAELNLLPACGHLPFYESPGQTSDALEELFDSSSQHVS